MKHLNHPKLVNLFAICSREEPIFIIMDYMPNGNLLNFLRDGPGQTLDISSTIDMAAQVKYMCISLITTMFKQCIHTYQYNI